MKRKKEICIRKSKNQFETCYKNCEVSTVFDKPDCQTFLMHVFALNYYRIELKIQEVV